MVWSVLAETCSLLSFISPIRLHLPAHPSHACVPQNDSIDGIYDTLKECAVISKCAGGIGLHIHNIRATGSYIRGTNGTSNGIMPMLRVFNDTARYVDQGGGKRKGAFAIYLEPWHADVFDWLDLRKNTGKEEARARDLFYGLWIPDLFMKVREGGREGAGAPGQSVRRAGVGGGWHMAGRLGLEIGVCRWVHG